MYSCCSYPHQNGVAAAPRRCCSAGARAQPHPWIPRRVEWMPCTTHTQRRLRLHTLSLVESPCAQESPRAHTPEGVVSDHTSRTAPHPFRLPHMTWPTSTSHTRETSNRHPHLQTSSQHQQSYTCSQWVAPSLLFHYHLVVHDIVLGPKL